MSPHEPTNSELADLYMSMSGTRSVDHRDPRDDNECPECGATRRTRETLRAHRAIAHEVTP